MFEAAPRPVHNNASKTRTATKAKYRDPADTLPLPKSNIHFDKRVVRGNTYAAHIDPAATLQLAPPRPGTRTAKPARNSAARRRLHGETVQPAAESSRTHMLVQTDDFLEELVDEVFEQDSGTQTDALDDLPVPPIFMPKPVGEDMGTSIEPGELFDFELAVEPCLEVLAGKALEQALMEVLEEEEISRLREHRERFEQERNQIIAETQRMEAHSLRHHQEKERRLQQERERLAAEKELAKKSAARTAAKHFLSSLSSNVLSSLQSAGHLYDPVARQVEQVFLPWLMQDVHKRLTEVAQARGHVDELLGDVVKQMHQIVADKRAAEEAEAARLAAEAAEKARLEEEARLAALEAETQRLEQEAAEAAEKLRRQAEAEKEEGEDDEEDAEEEEDEEDEDV